MKGNLLEKRKEQQIPTPLEINLISDSIKEYKLFHFTKINTTLRSIYTSSKT